MSEGSSFRTVDPTCPNCNEPIGATAEWCMHCYVDLPDGPAGMTPRTFETNEPDTDGYLLDPDGFLDNTLTLAVGLVAGVFAGVIMMFGLFFALHSAWGILLGIVGGFAVAGQTARQSSVSDGVLWGTILVACSLFVFPFIAFSPGMTGGSLGGRIILFMMIGAVVFLIAMPITLVGVIKSVLLR